MAIYDESDDLLFEDYIDVNNPQWDWVELEYKGELKAQRYYIVINDFVGDISITNILVKTPLDTIRQKDEKESDTGMLMSAESGEISAPGLPAGNPWEKQGLNPFAALLSDGQEHVSTTSGLLTVSVTDAVISGRGGLDLTLSRYYNSKAHNQEKVDDSERYLPINWEIGLPRVNKTSLRFGNGSIIDLQHEEVKEKTEYIGDDRKIIYTNAVNSYFKLERYELYDRTTIFGNKKYKVDSYKLYLIDGTIYKFNKKGKIVHKEDRTGNNRINFYYNSDNYLQKIEDTIGRVFKVNIATNRIKIEQVLKPAGTRTLVEYILSGSGNKEIESVLDSLGRKTEYQYNNIGINKIKYPSGKISQYVYDTKDGSGYKLYSVNQQKIMDNSGSNEELVSRTDFILNYNNLQKREVRYIKTENYDENNTLIHSTYYHPDDDGMLEREKLIDEKKNRVVQTTYYNYDINKKLEAKKVYDGNIYENDYDRNLDSPVNQNQRSKNNQWILSEEEWNYDVYGNLRYQKDAEGYETMHAYLNTGYSDSFYNKGNGNTGEDAFYDNSSVNKDIKNLPAASLKIKSYSGEFNEKFAGDEIYYSYDNTGNLIERKRLLIDEYEQKEWLVDKFTAYDDYGNLIGVIYNASNEAISNNESIRMEYEYSSDYNNAYLTSEKRYISKNLVNDEGIEIPETTSIMTYEYDLNTGLQSKVVDNRGNSVVYEYDKIGRPTKMIYPLLEGEDEAAYEEVVYEDENNLVKVYDAERKNLSIHYFDGLGQEVKVEKYQDIEGEHLHSTVKKRYNWQGKEKEIVDENGNKTINEYDYLGRPVKIKTDDGNISITEYDDFKRKTININPLGVKTITYTDKLGQKTEVLVENEGEILSTKYQYDGFGNIIKTTDAEGKEMGFVYNNLGQLLEVKYPNNLGEVFFSDNHPSNLTVYNYYDSLGNLSRVINRNNEEIEYQYNEYNQAIRVSFSSSDDINYYYNELAQLVKVNQGSDYEKIYSYDARGGLVEQDDQIAVTAKNMSGYNTVYKYNKNNQLLSMKYPSAKTMEYSYNDLNQLTSVNWQGSSIVSNIDYNLTGHIAGINFGSGRENAYDYSYINGQYLPTHINYGQDIRFDYRYDQIGNITRINDQEYSYDDIGQLTAWDYLKDNDSVLIGEETIWEKEMDSHADLKLNGTQIFAADTDSSLRLAANLNYGLFDIGRLVDDTEVSDKEGLEKDDDGYKLYREPYVYQEEFRSGSYNSSDIEKSTSGIKLAELEGEDRWVSVLEDSDDKFKLKKDSPEEVNVVEVNNTEKTSLFGIMDGISITSTSGSFSNYFISDSIFSGLNSSLKTYRYTLGSTTPNKSYSGYQYTNSDGWQPAVNSSKWKNGGSFELEKFEDISKMKFKISASLRNDYNAFWEGWFAGWGNWNLWIKLETKGGQYLGMKDFRTRTIDGYDHQTKYLTVDLNNLDLINSNDLDEIKYSYLVNRWGNGSTHGGKIKSIEVAGIEQMFYPVNQEKSKTYNISEPLITGENYKINVEHAIPGNTSIRYELYKGSSKLKTFNLNGQSEQLFTVGQTSNNYSIKVSLLTEDKNISPEVKHLRLSRERKYKDRGSISSNTKKLDEKVSQIILIPDHKLPEGTEIDYYIGSLVEVPIYNIYTSYEYQLPIDDKRMYFSYRRAVDTNGDGRYIVNLGEPSNRIRIRAVLSSDEKNTLTPELNNIQVEIPGIGDYTNEGHIISQEIELDEQLAQSLIMELHGKENSGTITPVLQIGEEEIIGVRVNDFEEILADLDEAIELADLSSEEHSIDMMPVATGSTQARAPSTTVVNQAEELRQEIGDKNLSSYYYKFTLPADISYPETASIKINLQASEDLKSSPVVHSYLLFDSYLRYYQEGNFETASEISARGDYTFKKARIDTESIVPTGTSLNILAKEGSEYYTLAEGVDTLLNNYTDSLSIIGELGTNNSRLSPEIKKMSLTAIGESPLQNNIESLDDIVGTHSKLSLASDRAVGEKSILIDHSASGKASYTIKGESFNGEKLPIITIWVKPLTDNALSFTIYNPATGRDEIIYSDSSGDGYFEIGEDLYKEQWNMVYLDLRDTNGSLKELREFKVEIPEYGTKVLIDGVNSLPLNKTVYQYDEVGNRDEVEANGSKMRYFYQPGTNLLDRRESNLERVEYQYDYEGNLISQDILDRVTGESFYFDYEYNELNQLVEVYRNNSLIAEYSYDHEGLRYRKIDYLTGKTTIYIYGQGTEPVYEEIYSNDDLNTPIEKNSYLFMGTKRIAKDSNGSISYYYTDHLGSTRAVDVSGEISRLDYAPFGEDFRPTAERYKYTGKEDDISTGLHYFNARYYDPAIGRFITEDPAMDGINWYVYCYNNPLAYIDSTGEIPIPLVTGGIGALIGGGVEAYRSYRDEGQVNWKRVTKGAVIGGASGATLGAGASLLASSGTTAILSTGKTITGLTALAKYGDYASVATQNASSKSVVLGKYSDVGYSYHKYAIKKGYSYFHLEKWDTISQQIGDYNMWNINKAFLKQQIIEGKNFILTHDPFNADGYFGREIEYLIKKGYTFIQDGEVWKAVLE